VYSGIFGTAGFHLEDCGYLHFLHFCINISLDLTQHDSLTRRVVEKILQFCRYCPKTWVFFPSRYELADVLCAFV
jgi:hypothetical protein